MSAHDFLDAARAACDAVAKKRVELAAIADERGRWCSMCKLRPPQPGSDLCSPCWVEMHGGEPL